MSTNDNKGENRATRLKFLSFTFWKLTQNYAQFLANGRSKYKYMHVFSFKSEIHDFLTIKGLLKCQFSAN